MMENETFVAPLSVHCARCMTGQTVMGSDPWVYRGPDPFGFDVYACFFCGRTQTRIAPLQKYLFTRPRILFDSDWG